MRTLERGYCSTVEDGATRRDDDHAVGQVDEELVLIVVLRLAPL